MSWSRTGSFTDLLAWLLLTGFWWGGGWLLCARAFRLRSRERPVTGLAAGLLLFIAIANLLAQVLPLPAALWGAALLILAAGVYSFLSNRSYKEGETSAMPSPHRLMLLQPPLPMPGQPQRMKNHRGHWLSAAGGHLSSALPQLITLSGLTLLFYLINRGLAIFDDFHNLPLLSMIAAGDAPPHFYLNPDQRLAYHYGLHLFAASLVRIGGLFPWSAFDLAKAFSLALTVGLAGLWFRRATQSALGGLLGAVLALFGGGARWLLLFLPVPWLVTWGAGLHFLGSASASGTDLYTILSSPWKIEGGGPFPFPFAFVNGVFPSLSFALGGSGALPQMTVLLLLLLAGRSRRPLAALVYALVLASLALTGEHLFGMIWAGIFLATMIIIVQAARSRRHAVPIRQAARRLALWGAVLLVSAVLALTGGGVITEIARGLLSSPAGGEQSFGFAGFGLRWPPALLSAHLGPLALTNPAQILIALAETGPVLLLLPWVAVCTGRQLRRAGRRTAQNVSASIAITGLSLGAALGFILPLFVRYGVERDISRLTSSALFIWMVLGFPLAWSALTQNFYIQRGNPASKVKSGVARNSSGRALASAGYGVAILGGLALFMIALIAISRPQLSYFVQEPDALMSRAYWDQLEPTAQVLDPNTPFRSVVLFGRAGGKANKDLYTALPEWESLVSELNPASLALAGYAYVYIDKDLWQRLNPDQKSAFQQPCVRLVGEETTDERDFRRLLDIRECH
jgi:hypothetical protein